MFKLFPIFSSKWSSTCYLTSTVWPSSLIWATVWPQQYWTQWMSVNLCFL